MADRNFIQHGVEPERPKAEGENVDVASTEDKNDGSLLAITTSILHSLVEATTEFMDVFWDCEDDQPETNVAQVDKTGAEGEGHPVSEVPRRPEPSEDSVLPPDESQESNVPSNTREEFGTCQEYAEDHLKPSEEDNEMVEFVSVMDQASECDNVEKLSVGNKSQSTSSILTDIETAESPVDNSNTAISGKSDTALMWDNISDLKDNVEQTCTSEDNPPICDEAHPVSGEDQIENSDVDVSSQTAETSKTDPTARKQLNDKSQTDDATERTSAETQENELEDSDSDQLMEALEAFMKSQNAEALLYDASESDAEIEVPVLKEVIKPVVGEAGVSNPTRNVSPEPAEDGINVVLEHSEGSLIDFHIDIIDVDDPNEQEVVEYSAKEEYVKNVHLRPDKPTEIQVTQLNPTAVQNSGRSAPEDTSENSTNAVEISEDHESEQDEEVVNALSSDSSSRKLNTSTSFSDVALQNGRYDFFLDEYREPSYARLRISADSITSGSEVVESSSTDSQDTESQASNSVHDDVHASPWEKTQVPVNEHPSLTFTVRIRKINCPMPRGVGSRTEETSAKADTRKLRYPWNPQMNPPTPGSNIFNDFPEVAQELEASKDSDSKTDNEVSKTNSFEETDLRSHEENIEGNVVNGNAKHNVEKIRAERTSSYIPFEAVNKTENLSSDDRKSRRLPSENTSDGVQSQNDTISETTNFPVNENPDQKDEIIQCKFTSTSKQSLNIEYDVSQDNLSSTENNEIEQNNNSTSCEMNADCEQIANREGSADNNERTWPPDIGSFWQNCNQAGFEITRIDPGRDSIDVQRMGFSWENAIISSISFPALPLSHSILDNLAQMTGNVQEIPRMQSFIPVNYQFLQAHRDTENMSMDSSSEYLQATHEEVTDYNMGLNCINNDASSLILCSESEENNTVQNTETQIENVIPSSENDGKIPIGLHDSSPDKEEESQHNVRLSSVSDILLPVQILQDGEVDGLSFSEENSAVEIEVVQLENHDSGYETVISNYEPENVPSPNQDVSDVQDVSSSPLNKDAAETVKDLSLKVSEENKPETKYDPKKLLLAVVATENAVHNISVIIRAVLQAQKMAENVKNDIGLTEHINNELNVMKRDNCIETTSEFIFTCNKNAVSDRQSFVNDQEQQDTTVNTTEENGGLELEQENENIVETKMEAEECPVIVESLKAQNEEIVLKFELPPGIHSSKSPLLDPEVAAECKASPQQDISVRVNETSAVEETTVPTEVDADAHGTRADEGPKNNLMSADWNLGLVELPEENVELREWDSAEAEGDWKVDTKELMLSFIASYMPLKSDELGDAHSSKCLEDERYCECRSQQNPPVDSSDEDGENEELSGEVAARSAVVDTLEAEVNSTESSGSSEIQSENQVNDLETVENLAKDLKQTEVAITEEAESTNVNEQVLKEMMQPLLDGLSAHSECDNTDSRASKRNNVIEELEFTECVLNEMETEGSEIFNLEMERVTGLSALEKLEIVESMMEQIESHQQTHNEQEESQFSILENSIEILEADQCGSDNLQNRPEQNSVATMGVPTPSESNPTECENRFSEEIIADRMIDENEDLSSGVENKSAVFCSTEIENYLINEAIEVNLNKNNINDVMESSKHASDSSDNILLTGSDNIDKYNEATMSIPAPSEANLPPIECENRFSEETVTDRIIDQKELVSSGVKNKYAVPCWTEIESNLFNAHVFEAVEVNVNKSNINDVMETSKRTSDSSENVLLTESNDVDKYTDGAITEEFNSEKLSEIKEKVREYQKLVENVFTDIENEIEQQLNVSEIRDIVERMSRDSSYDIEATENLAISLNLAGNYEDPINLKIKTIKSKSDTISQGTESQPDELKEIEDILAGKVVEHHYASTEISEEHCSQADSSASISDTQSLDAEACQVGAVVFPDSEWTQPEISLSEVIPEEFPTFVVQNVPIVDGLDSEQLMTKCLNHQENAGIDLNEESTFSVEEVVLEEVLENAEIQHTSFEETVDLSPSQGIEIKDVETVIPGDVRAPEIIEDADNGVDRVILSEETRVLEAERHVEDPNEIVNVKSETLESKDWAKDRLFELNTEISTEIVEIVKSYLSTKVRIIEEFQNVSNTGTSMIHTVSRSAVMETINCTEDTSRTDETTCGDKQDKFLETVAKSEEKQDLKESASSEHAEILYQYIAENTQFYNTGEILENMGCSENTKAEVTNVSPNGIVPLPEEMLVFEKKEVAFSEEKQPSEESVLVHEDQTADETETTKSEDLINSTQEDIKDIQISYFTKILGVPSEATDTSNTEVIVDENQSADIIVLNSIADSKRLQVSEIPVDKEINITESLRYDVGGIAQSIDGQIHEEVRPSAGIQISEEIYLTEDSNSSEGNRSMNIEPELSFFVQSHQSFKLADETEISGIQNDEEPPTHIPLSETTRISDNIVVEMRNATADTEISTPEEPTLSIKTEHVADNTEVVDDIPPFGESEVILLQEQKNESLLELVGCKEMANEDGNTMDVSKSTEPPGFVQFVREHDVSDMHFHESVQEDQAVESDNNAQEVVVSEYEEATEFTDGDMSESVEIQSTVSSENLTMATVNEDIDTDHEIVEPVEGDVDRVSEISEKTLPP